MSGLLYDLRPFKLYDVFKEIWLHDEYGSQGNNRLLLALTSLFPIESSMLSVFYITNFQTTGGSGGSVARPELGCIAYNRVM